MSPVTITVGRIKGSAAEAVWLPAGSGFLSWRERILVVDDEDALRDVVCSILTHAGFECRPLTSGAETLSALRADGGYSLLLSDMIMEGMDGLTLLSQVRQMQPELPVVMVTAVHDVSIALAAIRNGAYDYLLKPFEREQLLAIVRRALETRRLKLENLAYQTKLESLVEARTEMLRQTLADLERSYDITLGSAGRRARSERRRDRRPLQASHRVYYRHCPRHGAASGPGPGHRPGSVSARRRQNGNTGCHPAQTGTAHRRGTSDHAAARHAWISDAAQDTFSP